VRSRSVGSAGIVREGDRELRAVGDGEHRLVLEASRERHRRSTGQRRRTCRHRRSRGPARSTGYALGIAPDRAGPAWLDCNWVIAVGISERGRQEAFDVSRRGSTARTRSARRDATRRDAEPQPSGPLGEAIAPRPDQPEQPRLDRDPPGRSRSRRTRPAIRCASYPVRRGRPVAAPTSISGCTLIRVNVALPGSESVTMWQSLGSTTSEPVTTYTYAPPRTVSISMSSPGSSGFRCPIVERTMNPNMSMPSVMRARPTCATTQRQSRGSGGRSQRLIQLTRATQRRRVHATLPATSDSQSISASRAPPVEVYLRFSRSTTAPWRASARRGPAAREAHRAERAAPGS